MTDCTFIPIARRRPLWTESSWLARQRKEYEARWTGFLLRSQLSPHESACGRMLRERRIDGLGSFQKGLQCRWQTIQSGIQCRRTAPSFSSPLWRIQDGCPLIRCSQPQKTCAWLIVISIDISSAIFQNHSKIYEKPRCCILYVHLIVCLCAVNVWHSR